MRKQFFVVTGHDYGEDIVTLTIHTQGKADSSPSHHQYRWQHLLMSSHRIYRGSYKHSKLRVYQKISYTKGLPKFKKKILKTGPHVLEGWETDA